mmetsp:Transcript_113473/g.316014  ORF Transcript_113473/g.316014 Transcript_113473/m.316014 type:complete len:843 (-) Transcript_113473:723-3251(-)
MPCVSWTSRARDLYTPAAAPDTTVCGIWYVLSGMSSEVVPLDENAACSRAQTPDVKGPGTSNQKGSSGASRPASLTPIGSPTPEQAEHDKPHANAWSICNLFGGGSPELPTFHPQPRRLHQPFVTPLLESEAPPVLHPEPPSLETVEPCEDKLIELGIDSAGSTAHERAGLAREDGANLYGEAFASTPSPGRENLGSANADWMESHADSPDPAAVHRSVQNTPEPAHYYNSGVGVGQPISTPSPSATPSSGNCNGHAPYLGLPPRLPDTQVTSASGIHGNTGVLLPPQISTDFSIASTVLPPPLPAAQTSVLPSSSENLSHVSSHPVGFGAQFRLPLESLNGGLFAQTSKHHVQGQVQGHLQGHLQAPLQGQLHGTTAATSQSVHHLPHGYHHAYTQAAAVGPLGTSHWRMPSCPVPIGFPPQHCVDMPLSAMFGSQASHSQSSAELRPPYLSTLGGTTTAASPLSCGSTSSLQGKAPKSSNTASTTAAAEAGLALPPEVNDMRGQVIQLSKTQAGSKYLQRQLLKGHNSVIDVILQEVEQDVAQLMCDAYGNYLCSVAFQACSVRQRQRMLEKLAPRVSAIARDKRGTHALQALIGLLSTLEEQEQLMSALKGHVLELCMDPNGTHVVQRLLFCFMPPCTDLIYYPVVDKLVEVAHHPYGLCVLKKCISQAKAPGKHQEILLSQLAQHALDLVQSPYGNYAVQHALEEWGGVCCMPIFKSLEGRMMQLSINKFSSNVVEKLFCSAPPEFRARFISELIESEKMSVLVNSNYGHYVVKRALQLAEPSQVRSLLDAIRGNVGQLPNRRLRAKWEKVLSAGSARLCGAGVGRAAAATAAVAAAQ